MYVQYICICTQLITSMCVFDVRVIICILVRTVKGKQRENSVLRD